MSNCEIEPVTATPEPITPEGLDGLVLEKVMEFDPNKVILNLESLPSRTKAVVYDISKNSLIETTFIIFNGRLNPWGEVTDYSVGQLDGKAGEYFLSILRRANTHHAAMKRDALGISVGGRVAGTTLQKGPDLTGFRKCLQNDFGGDFASLFPDWDSHLSVVSSTVASTISESVAVAEQHTEAKRVVYLSVHDGWTGLCVLTDNVIREADLSRLERNSNIDPVKVAQTTIKITQSPFFHRDPTAIIYQGDQFACPEFSKTVENLVSNRLGDQVSITFPQISIHQARLRGAAISALTTLQSN